MGKYLNIGNAGFESVRKSIYVDKVIFYWLESVMM